jgi:hypothetical protein
MIFEAYFTEFHQARFLVTYCWQQHYCATMTENPKCVQISMDRSTKVSIHLQKDRMSNITISWIQTPFLSSGYDVINESMVTPFFRISLDIVAKYFAIVP